jgi:hypothetical protein
LEINSANVSAFPQSEPTGLNPQLAAEKDKKAKKLWITYFKSIEMFNRFA